MRDAILMPSSLDLSVLIDRLNQQLTRDELIEFIKKLDLEVADWAFTNELVNYFDSQHEIYEREVCGN